MKVVIVGAGEIGLSIAGLLSNEHHEVVVIDTDHEALDRATRTLDIGIQLGSGTDWKLLEELLETGVDLFLALTGHDETNLVACEIAKALGVPTTVSRVGQWSYLNQTRLDFGRLFSVDHFVSPKLLAAQEIEKFIWSLGAIRVENFAHGAVQMRTFQIPEKWKREGKSLIDLDLPEGVMAGVIYRPEREEIIFPHGHDQFYPKDEVSLVGTAAAMEQIHTFFGISQKKVASAVVLGGGPIGALVAKDLSQRGVSVRLIEQDPDRCIQLSEQLHRVTVMQHDATDLAFLQSERVEATDVVISTIGDEELNGMTAQLVNDIGCEQVVATIGNPAIAHLLKEKGVSHLVSPTSAAANRIMAIARAKQVISGSALYDNRVKIMEVKVSAESKIVGIPLSELGPHLPKEFLFAVIQNRGRIMIANGDRILCPGDTTIVISSPKHTEKVLQLF